MKNKRNFKFKRKTKNNVSKVISALLIALTLIGCLSLIIHFTGMFKNDKAEAVFEDLPSNVDMSKCTSFNLSAASFVYQDLTLFEDSTVTKIGVPIKSVTDYAQDNVMTLYVVDSSSISSTSYTEKYELIIEANTFTSNTVNDWYYFEDLDIHLEKGQTLAFCASTDTIIPGYRNDLNTGTYAFYAKCLRGNNVTSESAKSIYFDVYKVR